MWGATFEGLAKCSEHVQLILVADYSMASFIFLLESSQILIDGHVFVALGKCP